jgi:hypothetical protein
VCHGAKRIQEAFGGSLTPDSIFLYFGPNDKKIGRQFAGDPNVDEKVLTLAGFSVLPWLDRFEGWHLGAKLMPPAPPPPGVAIKKAAALAEGKDADKAVQEARAKVKQCRLCTAAHHLHVTRDVHCCSVATSLPCNNESKHECSWACLTLR